MTGEETGIDVGLKVFLVTADGEIVENPRHYRLPIMLMVWRTLSIRWWRIWDQRLSTMLLLQRSGREPLAKLDKTAGR